MITILRGDRIEVSELKILLDLLGHPPDYRTALSQLTSGGKSSDRDRAIRQLCDRGFVAYSETILRFITTPPGKALLKLQSTNLPVDERDRDLLRQAISGYLTPSQAKLPLGDRQPIRQSLRHRGLIQAETKVNELWITPEGLAYLRHTYLPKSEANLVLSSALLRNYLRFLRTQRPNSGSSPNSSHTDEELLAAIRDRDLQTGSENYLPLFHLRQHLEPDWSREEVDPALYRLQRGDRILLSSVQDTSSYTLEQLQAGIPQDIGRAIFFVSLLEDKGRSP